jgi:hypothetical protein
MNIDKKINSNGSFVVYKQRNICLRWDKSESLQLKTEMRIPSPWSLLQTIESFVQFTMIGWMIRILKPRRLPHVHIFL